MIMVSLNWIKLTTKVYCSKTSIIIALITTGMEVIARDIG